MLDAYDRAREQSKSHEIETFHGNVAEAACRKWLAGFLPKRYGVTSGYVVSPGLASTDKIPHFDVIIYDQLNAPILWIEDSPDASPQGRSQAIPVEYVMAILEVKSSLSAETVRKSIDHPPCYLPITSDRHGCSRPDRGQRPPATTNPQRPLAARSVFAAAISRSTRTRFRPLAKPH
jgi:hypothetical protein